MKKDIVDYNKQPGKDLNIISFEEKEFKTLISVVMPFYNDKEYIRPAVYSVLNQTFPYFELIIVDDGSKDEESLKELSEIEKLDNRIKVFHKENEGLAATRDYGASHSSEESKYFFFLDSDDLIEKTYLECAYWTLETNKGAAWAYTDSVGFGADTYTWNKWFDYKKMQKENDLVATALIRKKDFWDVNGYELREKAVNEDWNFWLKMIAKEKYPVRMDFYGFWYRRKKKNSELEKARSNKKRALEIVEATARTIKKPVTAIQYPFYNFNGEIEEEPLDSICPVKDNNKKVKLLVIVPYTVVGGADKFNVDLLNGLDDNKFDITLISTEPAVNVYRHKFKESISIYDLSTFIDQKYWISFLNYIIKKDKTNIILNTNSITGYSMLPYLKAKYPEIPIIDYIHMEEWYNRNGGYSRDSSGVASVIDKTLTCNANSMRILEEHFGRNKNELDTVYIGVDEKKFDPKDYNKEELRKKYKLSKKYVIGFICRIAYQKRPFLLLEIIKGLKEKRNDFEFLIAGEGELFAQVKAKCKKLKIEENVRFLGNVSETQKVYAASDLTLNCSIKEGVALTSYESLSMGVPVISSDVGGQKELISEDVGIIVPCIQDENDIFDLNYSEEEINQYVEGVDKIINNLEEYKSKCRKRILSGFTINQMVERMAKILEDEIDNINKEKTENGIAMSQNMELTKDLIRRSFEQRKPIYVWQVNTYNQSYELIKNNYRFELFKEKMWTHGWYRSFIKTLQKMGVIRFIKKRLMKVK